MQHLHWHNAHLQVHAATPTGLLPLLPADAGRWTAAGIEVALLETDRTLGIRLTASIPLLGLQLQWRHHASSAALVLADHWERAYGDLAWSPPAPDRVMPWYFLLFQDQMTEGLGVATGAAALAHWQLAAENVVLALDVRCGAAPVALAGRTLDLATVVHRPGQLAERPFLAAREFCRQLCPAPLMPREPVYGGNDWYYAYGDNTAAGILADAQRVASWAPGGANLPYFVIDDGWQLCRATNGYLDYNGGPWHQGSRDFPDLPQLARQMRHVGVRPGIWLRPLLTVERLPRSWFLPSRRFGTSVDASQPILDPSVPEVLEHIATDFRRLRGWGFELIKHDWTTYDLLGRWGFDMAGGVTPAGWTFADRTRTTAEIITSLYRTIRQAAGDALLIGCNTIGHLAAGLVEIQRIGDDTSGREWERTRKMGINSLAFRAAQHGTFFAADADCVGLTTQIPWEMNRQWLALLAGSGTPLFVSADPAALGPAQQSALREAFAQAATAQPLGEPLDWLATPLPRRWQLNGSERLFNWDLGAAV